MKKNTIIVFLVLFVFTNLLSLKAPDAEKINTRKSLHQIEWIDSYDYMSQSDANEQVMNYIKAENEYTKTTAKKFKRLTKKIYKEMKSQIRENDTSIPYKNGDWLYYYEIKKNHSYGLNYRVNTQTGEKQILIDENQLAKGKEFFALGTYSISLNDSLLAYSVDYEGSENYLLMIKNIKTNQHFPEQIFNAENVVWSKDNKSFLYALQNDKLRTSRIMKHHLGSDPKNDEIVLEENDEAFYLSAYYSRSKEHIFISSSSKTTSENWMIDTLLDIKTLKQINVRKTNVEIFPDHYQDDFYCLSNENEANYQYFKFNIDDYNDKELLYSGNKNVVLNDVQHFKNYLVLSERINGQNRIRIVNRHNANTFMLNFDNSVYSVLAHSNPDANSDSLRFDFDSLTQPSVIYSINMKEVEQNTAYSDKYYKKLKVYSPKKSYNPELYKEEIRYVDIDENTRIPLLIVYRKDKFVKNNPCLLYAYGSYGLSEDPYFSSARLSLLDRGWVYVIAQIRGGGEYGKTWHNQGKLLQRKNTFSDFIACAEFLINNKYTSREKLAINGGSAGGMLIGAVINLRPELFKTAIADVPFVDVLSTMMDSTLSLTIPEYEEWGNPYEKEYFDYIRSYSPYENVKAQNYPHLLINAGFKDSRVSFWEPLKWTAKLRDLKTDHNLLLLKMNMNEGHAGSGDRYSSLKDYAFTYAFLIWSLEQ